MNLLLQCNPITYREMCQVISANMKFRRKSESCEPYPLTWRQVYEYDSRGELFMIPIWFYAVCMEMQESARTAPR